MEEKDLNYPFIFFRIGSYPLLISGKYVSDIQNIPDYFSIIPNGKASMRRVCTSFGRIIYVIDTKSILGIEGKNLSAENEISDKRKLIILNQEPLKGILVDEVLSVEKAEHFHKIERSCAASPFIENFYVFDKTDEIVMEFNFSAIMLIN